MKIDVRKTLLLFASGIATAGLLSSCMELSMQSKNWKSLDIYGKVIDQYGDPVAGARVRGSIGLNISMVESGGKFVCTQTDAQGYFHFLHIHGTGIGIWPQKEGYYYNLKIRWQRPADYVPDPNNPLIFNTWKIHGPPPLEQSEIGATLASDGRPERFDISSGKPMADGNFKISLSRPPNEPNHGLIHPYNWYFKIEIVNGGETQENSDYPFLAPESGYQTVFQFNMETNHPSWQSQYTQDFYFKTSSAKFGIMTIAIDSATQPPHVDVRFIINPSGSRDLEPTSFQ